MLSPLAIHHNNIKATSSAVSHLVVCVCFPYFVTFEDFEWTKVDLNLKKNEGLS
ncbi:hypothetical protein HanXRQr2_Chr08g0350741 [Helianthus annuus]|uniref:Uncharacterized protein n=1 Tax=Helianthus annuus TaxID=4232 RepID=A0A9K3IH08_HELAN|nr:hypothetical protein HanXRQr2_Chr08g0350741 [Helianthus annuus]